MHALEMLEHGRRRAASVLQQSPTQLTLRALLCLGEVLPGRTSIDYTTPLPGASRRLVVQVLGLNTIVHHSRLTIHLPLLRFHFKVLADVCFITCHICRHFHLVRQIKYKRLTHNIQQQYRVKTDGTTTDLYKYSPDAVPPIHTMSYHVATDKPPAQNGDKFRSIFNDNLQPIATREKKVRGTLLVDKHCATAVPYKHAPLSISYYNEISDGHIGGRCSDEVFCRPSTAPVGTT